VRGKDDVDAVMCGLQGAVAKTATMRFCSLSVRVGMVGSRGVSKKSGRRGRQWRRSSSSIYRTTSRGKRNGSLRKTVGRLSSSVSRRENLPDRGSFVRTPITVARVPPYFRLMSSRTRLTRFCKRFGAKGRGRSRFKLVLVTYCRVHFRVGQ
jgi:hypothetical protein